MYIITYIENSSNGVYIPFFPMGYKSRKQQLLNIEERFSQEAQELHMLLAIATDSQLVTCMVPKVTF